MKKNILLLAVLAAAMMGCNCPTVSTLVEANDPVALTEADAAAWESVKGVNFAWGTPDLVYSRSLVPQNVTESYTATAWRGERVSAQALFWSAKDADCIELEISDFKGEGATLPASIASVHFVRYTIADKVDESCRCGRPNGHPAILQADMLDDAEALSVAAKTTRPIWVTVAVPQDAKPGTYLYAGFSKSITSDEYRRRVEDGTICEVLAKHPIRMGDAFFIPAGRVHAICGGALIAEVQQSSDITYRIYDYGRMGMDGKPRELHTELAVDVLDYTVHKEYSISFPMELNKANLICECEFFTVRQLRLTAPIQRNLKHHDSFVVYMCLHGECTIGDSVLLKQGQSCLVPASCADMLITPIGTNDDAEVLEVFVDNEKFS